MTDIYTVPQTNANPDETDLARAMAGLAATLPAAYAIDVANLATRHAAMAAVQLSLSLPPPLPDAHRSQFRPAHRAASNEGSDVDAA